MGSNEWRQLKAYSLKNIDLYQSVFKQKETKNGMKKKDWMEVTEWAQKDQPKQKGH